LPDVPRPPSTTRDRRAVAFWVVALLAYALLGAFFPPFFLLGFWESIPFLLIVTWLAWRLLGRSARDPGPAG
jgi:hypothetical protein